jgi:hypothetical protein
VFHHYINQVAPHDWFRFVQAEYMMELLQREKYFGEPHTCHVIARAVASLIQARVVTGAFITLFKEGSEEPKLCENDHTWIALQRGWVLDLKPIGVMSRGPILVKADSYGPGYLWYQRYKRADWPKVIRKPETQRSVYKMRQALAQALLREPLSEADYQQRFNKLFS